MCKYRTFFVETHLMLVIELTFKLIVNSIATRVMYKSTIKLQDLYRTVIIKSTIKQIIFTRMRHLIILGTKMY